MQEYYRCWPRLCRTVGMQADAYVAFASAHIGHRYHGPSTVWNDGKHSMFTLLDNCNYLTGFSLPVPSLVPKNEGINQCRHQKWARLICSTRWLLVSSNYCSNEPILTKRGFKAATTQSEILTRTFKFSVPRLVSQTPRTRSSKPRMAGPTHKGKKRQRVSAGDSSDSNTSNAEASKSCTSSPEPVINAKTKFDLK